VIAVAAAIGRNFMDILRNYVQVTLDGEVLLPV
jgi:hypothetical protein